MNNILQRVQFLVESGQVRVSEHGYDELADDSLSARDVIAGVGEAREIEEYRQYGKGPCVLVLQHDSNDLPIHVVWGIPKGANTPAVVVTAYRPDSERWDSTFTKRNRP